MLAAVVTDYNQPPAAMEIADPTAGPGEDIVDLVASAISPRVLSQASGGHYTSTDELPLTPGVDGVGRTADGELRYFILPDTPHGALAERVAIDPRRSAPIPNDLNPVAVAAAMNPAMSSWIALRCRIDFPAGARVLILGATGNAGRMAIQIARHLGASRIAAAGRNPRALAALPALGADDVINLGENPDQVSTALARVGGDVDVVLDYLWGEPTAAALRAIVPSREDDSQPLTWIQIGSVAGRESAIPSAALRATSLTIVGSGQGSVSPSEILHELPILAAEVCSGDYAIAARAIPLRDVTAAWAEASTSTDRLVIVP